MSNLEPTDNRVRRTGPPRRATGSAMSNRMMGMAQREDENEISAKFLMNVWNQWWKWLIPISLILMVGSAGIVMMTFKPKYRVSSRINISEQAPWLIQREHDLKSSKFVATQIEMLRSPRVLSETLTDPKISQMHEIKRRLNPVKWLSEKGLEIQPVGQSTLVEIAFNGQDPDASSNLVNTIVANYFAVQSETKTSHFDEILDVLKSNKIKYEAAVAQEQRRVRQLSESLGYEVPQVRPGTTIVDRPNPVEELLGLIRAEEFKVAEAEAWISGIRQTLADSDFATSTSLIQAKIDSLPNVRQLREQIRMDEARLAQIEAKSRQGRDSTAYINAENNLRELKDRLNLLRVTSEEQAITELREMDRVDIERALKEKQTELKKHQSLVANLEEDYSQKRATMAKDGGNRLQLEFALQDLTRAHDLLSTISEREAQVKAEKGAPGRSELFRMAKPNYIPNQKLPYELLAASILGSLVIPFAIAFLFENSVRRISNTEQLETKTNADVIGEVSRLPARTNSRNRSLTHDIGLFEESIDSLRTNLLLSNEDSDMQVLSVCSAVSGEGKTSVSSQLAVSIARSTGQPILLIDGDMRAPDIHQIFEVPLSPGLADVLDGEVSLEQAINRSWSEHVHLLPAGELTKSPHKLLGTAALRELLATVRLDYRYVVIDTPPVLAASEALVIAKNSDRTIVCAMRDFSRESHVRMAHERLRSTGAETLGTVLNGVPVRSYAARYGSYGRHYSNPSS